MILNIRLRKKSQNHNSLHKWNALSKEVESQFLDIASIWTELSYMQEKT